MQIMALTKVVTSLITVLADNYSSALDNERIARIFIFCALKVKKWPKTPRTTDLICFEDRPRITKEVNIKVEFQDLAQKIQMSGTKPAILKAAEPVFEKNNGIWQPAMVFQWFEFNPGDSKETGDILRPGQTPLEIRIGYSKKFLAHASHVLAAVYTAGPELDEASAQAGREGNFLDGHFLDLLGLLILEKTEHMVKHHAQKKAKDAGWGVSPFLSPGSVHGWDLAEQSKLAELLPIEEIGVILSDAGVLSPFKTISCLIGIGPGYDTQEVGTTCRVCSKRDTCQMRLNQNTGY